MTIRPFILKTNKHIIVNPALSPCQITLLVLAWKLGFEVFVHKDFMLIPWLVSQCNGILGITAYSIFFLIPIFPFNFSTDDILARRKIYLGIITNRDTFFTIYTFKFTLTIWNQLSIISNLAQNKINKWIDSIIFLLVQPYISLAWSLHIQ